MKKTIILLLISLLLIVSACVPTETLPRDNRLSTIVAKTLTARPAFTPFPALTANPPSTAIFTNIPTDASPAIATASGTVYVRTIVENVNLRTNPGMLFQVSRVMAQGTRLQVLGLSPGGEWVNVLNDENINGWVGIHVVEEFPVEQFPTVIPTNVQQVTGRVLDVNGLPISGIGYAIEQQTNSKNIRTDTITDATGTFYAYLPPSLSGAWNVSYVSVSCTSNTMDADCKCLNSLCGTSYPLSATISLPINQPLSFTWK